MIRFNIVIGKIKTTEIDVRRLWCKIPARQRAVRLTSYSMPPPLTLYEDSVYGQGQGKRCASMQIFIDESGTFATRTDGSSIGVVGALVVTESQLPILNRRYAQLRPLLPKDSGEVKGRDLGESDVARVIDVARRSGLIYEVTAIDLTPDSAPAIEAHRTGQCDGLITTLTEKHRPELVAAVHALKRRLEQMPLQLYAQCVATFELLWTTLAHATSYYCQREPQSLGIFRWVVDAKAPEGITDWEDWWSRIVVPMMQSRSLQQPFPLLEGGDYSHFPAQERPAPDFLVEQLPHLKGKTVVALNAVLGEIEFSAGALPGLEMVDVLTNAVRRALMGRLDTRGWSGLSKIMIHRRGGTYVHIVTFGPERAAVGAAKSVLRELGKDGRSMLIR